MCSLGLSAVPGRNHSVAAVIVNVLIFIFNSATINRTLDTLFYSVNVVKIAVYNCTWISNVSWEFANSACL